jgi:hypothetical protein
MGSKIQVPNFPALYHHTNEPPGRLVPANYANNWHKFRKLNEHLAKNITVCAFVIGRNSNGTTVSCVHPSARNLLSVNTGNNERRFLEICMKTNEFDIRK